METHKISSQIEIAKPNPSLATPETRIAERFEKWLLARQAKRPHSLAEHLNSFIDRRIHKDVQEYLDNPEVSIQTRLSIMDALNRVLNWTGFYALVIRELESVVGTGPHLRPIRILDIGAGGGGLLKNIYRWAKKKGVPVELSGTDFSGEFVEALQERFEREKIPVNLFQGNACHLANVANGSFDFVTSTFMVHHLRRPEYIVSFLAEVYRVARKGWVVMDFDRCLRGLAYMQTCLISANTIPFTKQALKLVVEDGVKSVRRAYLTQEINFLLKEMNAAGLVPPEMTGAGCGVFPYWVIKGHKISLR